MRQLAVLLGTLLLVSLPGSARGQAVGPRLTDEGRTLILLDEVREPQEKRQPGITLTGNPMTGGRQVRIAGHGIAPLREIAAGCGTRSWRVGLSDFRETPETNVATYDVPGEVVIQLLNSPECALLIAGARIVIPRELVSVVWALPGSAPKLPPGKASSSAPTATTADPCTVRTPGGDPGRISPGERIRAVKAIEALGALRDWATGPQGKEKADYASRVAKAEMVVGEYLAGGQTGHGELASAIRAAMGCFKEALRVWPNVNQPWSSAAENVRGAERYLDIKSLAERQEEERTRRKRIEDPSKTPTGSATPEAEKTPTKTPGYSVKSITPIFSQLLVISSPQGFKTVFENARGTQYIRESVLEGENENKWTQMITITGAKDLASKPNLSPKKYAESIADGFKRACPNSFSTSSISEGKISGYDGFIAIVSCGTSPSTAGRTSESALIAVIKGESDYYTVQWAERTEPSSTPIAIDTTKWVERFKRLAPIKLCPIVPGEAAPYPSCVGSK